MLLRTLEAPLLGATCVVLADRAGRAVVVDAGGGVARAVRAHLAAQGLTCVGVLATHGHVDHTWDAGELTAQWSVPLHVHAADAYRLADPFGTLGPLGGQLRAALPAPPAPVADLATHDWPAHEPVEVEVGLAEPLVALHLPGHTEGSTGYLVDVEGTPTLLTGDVLFAGTIGRTDLPGGDDATMAATLRHLATLPPETVVVPGHGARSSIGAELRANPYLRAAR